MRKTHEYAAEQSVGNNQVMFQDPSDLKRAVTVLAGYREMLLQGLQLVQVEINTRCVAKQMDVAEKNSDFCDLSNVPLPADANINKCGDMLKKTDVHVGLTDARKSAETACEVECDCGYENKKAHSGNTFLSHGAAYERNTKLTCRRTLTWPFLEMDYPNMKPAEGDEYPDMECVKNEDAVEKPCCGIDPAKYSGGSCSQRFDEQSKAKPFQKRSVALEHEKSCTFTPVIDCGCGWKPKQEATLKCTNGNTEVVDCEKDESVIAPGERMDGLTSPEADGGNRCLRERIRELAAADQIASIAELDVSRVTDFSGAVREQTRSRRSRRLCRE